MLDQIYNTQILAFAGNIARVGRLESPSATAMKQSKLCGSKITVDIALEDGLISGYAQEVKACALGQAAAAIMAKNIIGSSPAELFALRDVMEAMLKRGGPPPAGRWHELECLLPVRDHKSRHASTMLPFDAVADALGQLGYDNSSHEVD